MDYQQIANGNIANQIHGFTKDYGKFILNMIMQSSSFVFREGLEWADIDWVDNGECLDLIEKVSTTILMKRAS